MWITRANQDARAVPARHSDLGKHSQMFFTEQVLHSVDDKAFLHRLLTSRWFRSTPREKLVPLAGFNKPKFPSTSSNPIHQPVPRMNAKNFGQLVHMPVKRFTPSIPRTLTPTRNGLHRHTQQPTRSTHRNAALLYRSL